MHKASLGKGFILQIKYHSYSQLCFVCIIYTVMTSFHLYSGIKGNANIWTNYLWQRVSVIKMTLLKLSFLGGLSLSHIYHFSPFVFSNHHLKMFIILFYLKKTHTNNNVDIHVLNCSSVYSVSSPLCNSEEHLDWIACPWFSDAPLGNSKVHCCCQV